MQRYAEKCGAAFHVITEHYRDDLRPDLSKFYLLRYLQQYERVLYLDADILIRPSAVNLFDDVAPHQVGCVLDVCPEDIQLTDWITGYKLFKQAVTCTSTPEPVARWVQCSCMLYSRCHLALFYELERLYDLFQYKQRVFGYTGTDQELISELLNHLNYDRCVLPRSMYCIDPWRYSATTWGSRTFLHYGTAYGKGYMVRDVDSVRKQWESTENVYRVLV
jgi:hypothetical protein